jgi:2-hydroxyacyl-CoA lyase 1
LPVDSLRLLSYTCHSFTLQYLSVHNEVEIMTFGAKIIAQALHDLGVQVIFGLPGLPVIDLAQEGLYLGIRFISFRNEQAAVYAATAYGYLSGKPGVCICVGAPGVLHTLAGVSDKTEDQLRTGLNESCHVDTTCSGQLLAIAGPCRLYRNAQCRSGRLPGHGRHHPGKTAR